MIHDPDGGGEVVSAAGLGDAGWFDISLFRRASADDAKEC